MDDGLVLIKGMNPRIQNKFVLILIVVDDGLVHFCYTSNNYKTIKS